MKSNFILAILCALILVLSLRGISGNILPNELNTPKWVDNGPFDLSPERGRFALTYSIIETGSPFFSVPIARFATPDLGYKNNHYVSLFAPAVSFLVMPGYWIGKWFGLAQVGSFAVVALFAVFNTLLIRSIAIKLGAHPLAASLGALAFLFGTPAFTYGTSLYQHHISTFLILASVHILLTKKSILSLIFVWLLCAASIPVDYPNLVLMAPIGIFALSKLVKAWTEESQLKLRLNLIGLLTLISVVLPLAFFIWFNNVSYANPFQLSGTVPSVERIDSQGKPAAPENVIKDLEKFTTPDLQKKSAVSFFQPRNMINGFYIELISPDRGILFYAPVVILGILGVVIAYRKKLEGFSMLIGIIGANLVLYSMWGDPWGGWAFGSRYLIPLYAVMSIFLGLAVSRFRSSVMFLILFLTILSYSVSVNTMGALTSSRNPPQVEILQLEKISKKQEKYTFSRNWDLLRANKTVSYVYSALANRYFSALQYYFLINGLILFSIFSLSYFLPRIPHDESYF
jgi:hypothetical protein